MNFLLGLRSAHWLALLRHLTGSSKPVPRSGSKLLIPAQPVGSYNLLYTQSHRQPTSMPHSCTICTKKGKRDEIIGKPEPSEKGFYRKENWECQSTEGVDLSDRRPTVDLWGPLTDCVGRQGGSGRPRGQVVVVVCGGATH